VDATFRAFLNRNPGRLSPASVGEYRRRVGRAIEEFVRWVEDPGGYGFRGAPRLDSRRRLDAVAPDTGRGARQGPSSTARGGTGSQISGGITLQYPLRPDMLAHVIVPRDLTVEEARRMGAFLVTLAVDFRPVPAGEM
jgi:hypothetical protein